MILFLILILKIGGETPHAKNELEKRLKKDLQTC
jgi:hypothetical protein